MWESFVRELMKMYKGLVQGLLAPLHEPLPLSLDVLTYPLPLGGGTFV